MNDQFGLALSTNDASLAQCFNEFTNEIIAFGCDAEKILSIADEHPQCAILQLAAASFWLFAQESALIPKAQTYLNKVNLSQCNSREKAYHAIINAWAINAYEKAIEIGEQALKDSPQDLYLLSWMQYLYFCSGQYFNGGRFKQSVKHCLKYHSNNPNYLAMSAFAHQLCDEHQYAIQLAHDAMSIDENTPWAHHCLAHAYANLGMTAQAVEEIAPFAKSWAQYCRPLYSHNTWHLAVLRLQQGNYQGALKLYDHYTNQLKPDLVAELIDCIALLWRLKMLGVDVSERLQQLIPLIELKSQDCITVFISAHYVFALASCQNNDLCNELLSKIKLEVKDSVWQECGLPLLNAIIAYTQDDYSTCIEQLAPIIKQEIYRVGGSDAQCELFQLMYIEALIKAKRKKEASEFLTFLLRFRTVKNPLDARLQAEINQLP